MLSNIISWSTAAFGGTPFRFSKCTALDSAGKGASVGAAAGGVPGALVGGALGMASSLVEGLFGKHNTDKTNEMNYKIMQEQNKFNAAEAEKLRNWQEMMYRMYGTSSAKANDMRAAGLNALLGSVAFVPVACGSDRFAGRDRLLHIFLRRKWPSETCSARRCSG